MQWFFSEIYLQTVDQSLTQEFPSRLILFTDASISCAKWRGSGKIHAAFFNPLGMATALEAFPS